MTVAELIHVLQAHDSNATVVVWERDIYGDARIGKLGMGEVRPIQLGTWDSDGMPVLEAWTEHDELQGPYPGVVLGSL